MRQTFKILRRHDEHKVSRDLSYPESHPYFYFAKVSGEEHSQLFISKNSYPEGNVVELDIEPLYTDYKTIVVYVDQSKDIAAKNSEPVSFHIPAEIMVQIGRVDPAYPEPGCSFAQGTIFFVPEKALAKAPEGLTAAFREGAGIRILTGENRSLLDNYQALSARRAFGFKGLQVRVLNNEIVARHAMPAP